jgi:Xaa-Pro aminopeptidase
METDDVLNLPRMRRERYAKLLAEMDRRGVGAALLIVPSNVAYTGGARGAMADGDRAGFERTVALAVKGQSAPHLFTAYPEGAPPEIPADHVHPPLYPDLEEGVRAMAETVRDIAGARLSDGLAIDEYTAAMYSALLPMLSGVRIADATPMLHAVRICKTADEIECIKRAQRINELAMYDVQAQARPGVRQNELMGLFLRRIFELGAMANVVDPIWQPMAPALAWSSYDQRRYRVPPDLDRPHPARRRRAVGRYRDHLPGLCVRLRPHLAGQPSPAPNPPSARSVRPLA